jgi:tRNA dimethylallyltransferase
MPGPVGVQRPLVVAVFGPTASGKSDVAEAVAARLGTEVVSCDAMQAYQGLPILTNKPTRPTRLVGMWPLDHDGSVGEYQPLAHAAIDELIAGRGTAVVAGGTGLYLRAALGEFRLPPPPPPGLRRRLETLYDRLGGAETHRLLAERDPEAAAAVHANDRRRIIRALELNELGGSLTPDRDRLWSDEARHPTLVVGLDVAKDELDRRIERRACAMFAAGVEEEVRAALTGPVSETARKMIGLDEVGTLPREQALAALIARTRHYAAYQRKWMRRIPGVVIVDAERPGGAVADEILEVARARQRLSRRRAG